MSLALSADLSAPFREQDPIRFRNLVKELETSLRQKYPAVETRLLLEPFEALAYDHAFWNHTLDGLAVLDGPSLFRVFRIAIAGPIVSLSLAILFYILQPMTTGFEPLLGLLKYLAYINFALVLFNLIPGYPLDGGRVFRAIVWAVTKNMRRATLTAANMGRFFGYLFIFAGVWRIFSGDLGGGLWIAFIGWFLENAASAQIQQVMFQGLLAGHKVAQAMSSQCVAIPTELTLQQLVDDHVLSGARRCFLVNRGSETVGLMTLHRIKIVPRDEWQTTNVAQAMLPLDKLIRLKPDEGLWDG